MLLTGLGPIPMVKNWDLDLENNLITVFHYTDLPANQSNIYHRVPSVHLSYWTSVLWLIDSYQTKVSADQYHVAISLTQVRGRVFFEGDSWPGTEFLIVSQFKLGYYSGGECKLNPDALLTFVKTYSLHNCLLEIPWYFAYLISTMLSTFIRFALLKCDKKKKKKKKQKKKPG